MGSGRPIFRKSKPTKSWLSLCPIYIKQCPNREELEPEWDLSVPMGVGDCASRYFLAVAAHLHKDSLVTPRTRQTAWGAQTWRGCWQWRAMTWQGESRLLRDLKGWLPHKLFIPFLFCVNIFILLWQSNNIRVGMVQNVCRNVDLYVLKGGAKPAPTCLFIRYTVHIHF